MIFTIELPYPPPILSPNARAHWARVYAARLRQSTDAMALAQNALGQRRLGRLQSARVTLAFCPPDHRRRDIDNMLGSMKGALDGIATALDCDDSKFTLTLKRCAPRKGGAVIVTVRTG